MKFYAIVPAFGKDKIQEVFRVNDDGAPEKWDAKAKTWVFSAFLYKFLTGEDIGYREITQAEADKFTGA